MIPQRREGQRLVLQEGYPGYSLVRRRYVFAPRTLFHASRTRRRSSRRSRARASSPFQKSEWPLRYPSTSQIVAIGSGSKTLKKKEQLPAHHIPPLRPEDRPAFRLTKYGCGSP